MMRKPLSILATALLLAACGGDDSNTPTGENNANSTAGKSDIAGGTTVCAAVRGNGELVPAHFSSLARIVEHYGPVHAISGGSSGSISSFFLSSIQANPVLDTCGEKTCTGLETANREALLLKSFQGYLDYQTTTQEALAVQAIIPIAKKIQEAGIEETLKSDANAAAQALIQVLEADELFGLVNPEVIALIGNSPNPQFHVQDIIDAVKGFGQFKADDPTIFVRPGVLNFEELADRLGIAASFYAGYGNFDAEGVDAFLDNCADASRGKTWNEIRTLPSGDTTCGAQFVTLMTQYHDGFDGTESRADDPVGTHMPMLISTSVLTGDAVTAWEGAREAYTNAEEVTLSVNFEDIRFGYFGDSDSLDVLENVTAKRTDLKSQKAHAIGTMSWRQIIALSPAEPGLARALEIGDGTVSAGGWSDLHPTLVLRDMGCDKVVYVTRKDPESGFAQGVASLLGMTEADKEELYDLSNPASSFSESIAVADAVWCTNWNDVNSFNVDEVVADAYGARLFTDDEFFTSIDTAYDNISTEAGVEGCSL